MKRLGKISAGVLASFMVLSTTALTAVEAGAALKDAKQVVVQPGALSGVVVDSAGKGLVKAVVDVRDSRGDVVALGITKADGSFGLAAVPDGAYRLSVNGEFTYSLLVAKDAEAKVISLVVPAQSAYSAGAGLGGLTGSQLAGLGVFGVAAAVVITNSGGDCP